MRIKFLQTTPSDTPDFPFQAGQIIEVLKPSPSMRTAIKAGWAVTLPGLELEAATVGAPERAVQGRAKGHAA